MKYIALISLFLLSSCTSIKDVTAEIPVNFDLGFVKLKTAATLCLRDWNRNPGSIKLELEIPLSESKCHMGKLAFTLDSGSTLNLEKVIKHTIFGVFIVDRWYALGKYKVKDVTYSFYYDLNMIKLPDGSFKNLSQVPW